MEIAATWNTGDIELNFMPREDHSYGRNKNTQIFMHIFSCFANQYRTSNRSKHPFAEQSYSGNEWFNI